ncbi:MAG: DUF979 domain-containing protein [Eggerthia catenaformis]|uniref:DUF979 domain-containing protein n=1 Tax=Eggerthia catenaformis TaxID=31973 RepID=UPI003FA1076E
MDNFLTNILPEIAYALCGLVCFNTAYRGLKNEEAKYGTTVFWGLLGIIFMFGKIIPPLIVGIIIVVMGILTLTKQVKMSVFADVSQEEKVAQSKRVGNKIFIPAVAIGLFAFLLSLIKYKGYSAAAKKITNLSLNGAVLVGGASLIALGLAIIICRPKVNETRENTSRLLMQVGASCLLPQLLAALGTVLQKAGVGEVISKTILHIIPNPSITVGVIIYVLGMVIFTIIMGNAFSAFTVITIGIGAPFVIAKGGNPAIIGALGMTAGYCGTLLTPMAANFNIVPCAILETKDQKWGMIKTQWPISLLLIVAHIILMLTIGFN